MKKGLHKHAASIYIFLKGDLFNYLRISLSFKHCQHCVLILSIVSDTRVNKKLCDT